MERTIDNVKKLMDKGKSIREIAKFFGITYTPMRKWMIKNGFPKEQRRKWTDEQFIEAVKVSKTIAEVLRRINLKNRAGNYNTFHKYVKQLNLSTKHFVGQRHGTSIPSSKRSLEEIMIKNSSYSRSHLKKGY